MLCIQALLLGLIVTTTQAQGQSCDTNNGGCSHNCLDRGIGSVVCGCPCLMELDNSNLNCVATGRPCDVDLFVLIDESNVIEQFECLLVTVPSYPFTWAYWLPWRNSIANILESFHNLDSGDQWNVGVQIYSVSSSATTIHEYSESNLNAAAASLRAQTRPLCEGNADYVYLLEKAVEILPSFTNHVYRGPGTRRDALNTSRIALVFTAGFTSIQNSEMQLRMDNILLSMMDDVLVVSKKQLVNEYYEEADQQKNEEINRIAACNDASSSSCPDYFYIDSVNDLDQTATQTNLIAKMDTNACLARQAADIVPVVTCGTKILVVIPKCFLGGMTLDDLALLDSSCSVSEVGLDCDSTYTVTVPMIACGIVIESTLQGILLHQKLTTRVFSATQNLPEVNIDINCTYSSYTVIPTIAINQIDPKSLDAEFYNLTFDIYLTSNFSSPLEANEKIDIGNRVYLQAISSIPAMFFLQLRSCFATPSPSFTDSTQCMIVQTGCPVDPTFESITAGQSFVEFSFEMFEFYETLFLPSTDKLSVYIHCIFTACALNDSSERCQPSCGSASRRRRNLEEDENVIVRTIGPFKINRVEYQNTDHQIEMEEIDFVADKKSVAWTFYNLLNDGLILIAIVVLLMIVVRQSIRAPEKSLENKSCKRRITPSEMTVSNIETTNLKTKHATDEDDQELLM